MSTRAIGVLRALTGLTALLATRPFARRWVGRDDAAVVTLTRGIGGRDLAIGTGLLVAPGPSWYAASIGSDLVDGIQAVSDGERRIAGVALGFGAASVVAALVDGWGRDAAGIGSR